jgi:hypothetical protein
MSSLAASLAFFFLDTVVPKTIEKEKLHVVVIDRQETDLGELAA